MNRLIDQLKRLVKSEKFYLILLIFITLVFIMPRFGSGDYESWISWTNQILDKGLIKAMSLGEINYMPIFLYILAAWGNLLKLLHLDIKEFVFTIKIVVLLFDFGCLLWSIKILGKFKLPWQKALVILLNIALLYNTMLWAQMDAIMDFFVLGSVYFALTKKPVWSFALLSLALLTKIQAIIYVPYLVVWNLPILVQLKWRYWLKTLVVSIIVMVIVCLPFVISGSLGTLWKSVMGSVDLYPVVAVGAYNFWPAIFGGEIMTHSDKQLFLFLSLKQWGLIMFITANLFIAIPFCRRIWNWRKKFSEFLTKQENWAYLFLILSLVTQAFFLFPTQMHERYIHPALIFTGIWMFLQTKVAKGYGYLLFLGLSLAAFLNSERLLQFLPYLNHEQFPFSSRFIGIMILVVFAASLVIFYKYKNNE